MATSLNSFHNWLLSTFVHNILIYGTFLYYNKCWRYARLKTVHILLGHPIYKPHPKRSHSVTHAFINGSVLRSIMMNYDIINFRAATSHFSAYFLFFTIWKLSSSGSASLFVLKSTGTSWIRDNILAAAFLLASFFEVPLPVDKEAIK